jgi:hypothetical protein
MQVGRMKTGKQWDLPTYRECDILIDDYNI